MPMTFEENQANRRLIPLKADMPDRRRYCGRQVFGG
jgi:hypothetical protein